MFQILLLALVAIVVIDARPQSQRSPDGDAKILRSEGQPADENGSYNFAFETSNGIKREESGRLEKSQRSASGNKLQDGDGAGMEVQGSYSYIGPDGKMVTVTYTAGQNGFRPKVTYA